MDGAVPFTLAGGVLRSTDPLTVERQVQRPALVRVATTVHLGPLGVPLGPLRIAAIAALLLAAAGAAAASRGLLTPTDADLLARARPVEGGLLQVGRDRTVVEVGTAATLVGLARDVERPVLQVTESGASWFVVDDGAVVYRLRAERATPGHREGTRTILRAVEDPARDLVADRAADLAVTVPQQR